MARFMYCKIKITWNVPQGEYYLCDNGYRCKHSPGITKRDIPANELQLMTSIMGRHVSINHRLKQWGILQQRFWNKESLHKYAFGVIVVITQIEIVYGYHIWECK